MAINASTYQSLRGIADLFGVDLQKMGKVSISPLPSRHLITVKQEGGFMPPPMHTDPANGTQVTDSKPHKKYVEVGKREISRRSPRERVKPGILIIDLDYTPKHAPSKALFWDRNYIILPTVPLEVEFTQQSVFAAIQSQGRNNPFYHYTGSEDTVTFAIDFYIKGDDPNAPNSVIEYCRFLEKLTKADGYGITHRVTIKWATSQYNNDNRGQSFSQVLEDQVWYVVSAPYKLSNFAAVGPNLLARQAVQTVTLKRVTYFNLKHDDITTLSSGVEGSGLDNQPALTYL